MKDKNYKQLTSRNGYFIDEKLQKRIFETKLVFIGCGLASTVADSAARLGFSKFLLIDGDNVELNNLNRQNFYLSDLGKNKAVVTAEKIKSINPAAEVETVDRYILASDVEEFILKGDVIINSADFNEVTYAIDEASARLNKLSISPLNIGFGSIVTAFGPNSARLSSMTNGIAKNDKQYLLNFYKSLKEYSLPKYVQSRLASVFFFIARKGFFPQNIIAAHTSSAIILDLIIRHLDNKKIRLAPYVNSLDIEELNE